VSSRRLTSSIDVAPLQFKALTVSHYVGDISKDETEIPYSRFGGVWFSLDSRGGSGAGSCAPVRARLPTPIRRRVQSSKARRSRKAEAAI
jgi:hypothetical protein